MLLKLSIRCVPCLSFALLTSCALQQPSPVPSPASSAPTALVQKPSSQPAVAVAGAVSAGPGAAPAIRPPESDSRQAAATIDKTAALQAWVDQENRLYRVAAPLVLKNTELCPHHVHNILGFTAKNRYSYAEAYTTLAHSALGLGEKLRVMNVLPGSGAELAGIRKGDVLLAAEIEPLPSGPTAERDGAAIIASEMRGRQSMSLTVLRGGQHEVVKVPLTSACAMAIELGNTDDVSSFSDGYRMVVTRGMLQYVHSDQELAYVIAKEVAHNILESDERQDMADVIDRLQVFRTRTVPMAADRVQPYTPVRDATADKLSLYMLARAGYDIDNTLSFWQHLAEHYPIEIYSGYGRLHPSSSYRFSVMAEITKVLKTKEANNLPLMP